MIWWWLLLLFFAGPVGWVARIIRNDHDARRAAEAHAAALEERLGQSYEAREHEAIEWAERVQQITAIALCLDVNERTS